jgi:hypothetical protein
MRVEEDMETKSLRFNFVFELMNILYYIILYYIYK